MDQSETPKLIKPFEALKILEHLYGGPIDAKKLIADKIRDGEIGAFAKRTWVSREPNLRLARNAEPPKDAVKFGPISRTKLIGAESWADEALRWKWRRGIFHTVASTDPVKRRIFKGVRLVEEDILRLVARAKAARQKDASNAGAPRKSEAWDELWLTTIDVLTKKPLDMNSPRSQKALIKDIFDDFTREGRPVPPTKTTVEMTVSKIYARLFPTI